MKSKTFSNGLVVKHRRSAIILENADGKPETQSRFAYPFTPKELETFTDYLHQAANEAWKDITPKEAFSMGSDYDEYYDRRYDNNGYLSITESGLSIEAPHLSKDTLYQFNKAKIQSFIYDLQKLLSAIEENV
ncbi:hypothetical protein [Evansella clarkii]|uniref:hypothetical protein n=1 Tax=Evansella clarkii TaxID=79879 RepID=UPI000998B700|nr:hypothetical protein [Evansella clarkii]